VREDNRKIVDAAVRPANGDSDGATLKVTSAIRKAQDAFYKGSYEEAQILTRKSIEARPTPEAHALAGSIAWTLKDFPLARFHWKQALSLDPDFPGVSDMLIRLPQETVR
jgi:tetratricopeptide (TPR) repeat protein